MKPVRMGLAVMFFAIVGIGVASGAQSPQLPLAPTAIPKFAQPLPILSLAGGTMSTLNGNGPLTIRMCEFDAQVLPPPMPVTRVWGYIAGACPASVQDTYIGPVIVSERATAGPSPTTVTWINELGNAATTGVLAYRYSTDQTIHWADPANNEANMCAHMFGYPAPGDPYGCDRNYAGPVPAVVHLHGGEVPPMIDGNPDAWITSDGSRTGSSFYSFPSAAYNAATYKYPNVQEAAPLWFHDHTLGATRLNVYAGLAGAYLLTDNTLSLPTGLHPAGLSRDGAVDFTIPLVIQDRMFDTNGQLFFQADSAGGILWALNPEHPYWSPEFVGDTIVVNGKAWPYLKVEPKRYRFWFINGSNARTYEMFLQGGGIASPLMYVIATDGGYLDNPAPTKKLLLMPGERYEVIVDFAGAAPGSNLILRNTAKTPFPGGATPQGSTLGQLMQFQVTACTSGKCGTADTSYNPALGGAIRNTSRAIKRLANPATGMVGAGVTVAKTRQLTLNEIMGMPRTAIDPVTGLTTVYPGGPLEILLNNSDWDGKRFIGVGANNMLIKEPLPGSSAFRNYYITEMPKEGETEVWEIVNLTADAHPIHLHLVQFQLINRQNFDVNAYNAAYWAKFPSGFDFTTGLTTLAGTFIPGFGPPCGYDPASANSCNTRAYGGNPDIAATNKNGGFLYLRDGTNPPLPQEAGWKDTMIMYPGQVTRIAVRWAPTDLPVATLAADAFYPFNPNDGYGYVWHCHIIDHEDNEMMRPDAVTPNAGASRSLFKGTNY